MGRLCLLIGVLLASSALSAEAPPGAAACSGCHGASGIPLDGLSASDIEAAMIAFRSGDRDATLMNRIAAGFTEGEITAIAVWLAGGGLR
jgi:cytochrome c553